MTREEILKYAPIVYMDANEPIQIKRVGYAVYEEDKSKSLSFNRTFDFQNVKGTKAVIEFAYYLDYDIQHLYDLEHIWVYIDGYGNVVGAEGSYHGRFLNAFVPGLSGHKDNKVVMYSQPGKHAMLSDPKLMYLYTELFEACDRLAGINGLDAPERYLTDIHITEDENKRVKEYIKKQFKFTPAMRFVQTIFDDVDYMPWEELQGKIPEYIQIQLNKIFK
ncbi:hypothetical protein [Butyrivibrio proteoclasticus]|uniref:hypothetical protein n=1 Tax=Butyrivibrio proteoclasticus TaxID=43305 RepID=UPI000687167A|nr:hypothetical protein [Butyrivibrio proteoclasticus]